MDKGDKGDTHVNICVCVYVCWIFLQKCFHGVLVVMLIHILSEGSINLKNGISKKEYL